MNITAFQSCVNLSRESLKTSVVLRTPTHHDEDKRMPAPIQTSQASGSFALFIMTIFEPRYFRPVKSPQANPIRLSQTPFTAPLFTSNHQLIRFF